MPAEQQLLNVIVKIIKKGCNEIFGTTTFQGPFCCCFFFFFSFFTPWKPNTVLKLYMFPLIFYGYFRIYQE